MKTLAKTLVFVALFFSIVIPQIGFLQGHPPRDMFLVGLALAFATIPEELPIIITMNLGLGSFMLAKENFLVKKLKAAEMLGIATVIVTDKTGTITESMMQVIVVSRDNEEKRILISARLLPGNIKRISPVFFICVRRRINGPEEITVRI